MCMQEASQASELPAPRLHKSDPLQASPCVRVNECTLFAASITLSGCVCTFPPPLSFTLAAIMEILGVVEDLEHIHKTSGGSTFLRGNEKLFSCILTSAKSQKVHFRGFKGARNTLLLRILPQMKNDRAVQRRWTVSPEPLIADGVFIFYLCSSKQDILMAPPPASSHRSPRFLLIIDLSSPSWTAAAPGTTFRDVGENFTCTSNARVSVPPSVSFLPLLAWIDDGVIASPLASLRGRGGEEEGRRARDRKWVVLLCRSSVRQTPGAAM